MIQIWCDVCVWIFTLTKKNILIFSHMRMADSGEATEITNIVHTFFASITICSNFGTPPLVRSAILRRSKTAAWFYTKRRPVHFSYELCITKLCCLQKIPPWTQSSELPVSNIAAGRWMVNHHWWFKRRRRPCPSVQWLDSSQMVLRQITLSV